jgi:hypothetical protein
MIIKRKYLQRKYNNNYGYQLNHKYISRIQLNILRSFSIGKGAFVWDTNQQDGRLDVLILDVVIG